MKTFSASCLLLLGIVGAGCVPKSNVIPPDTATVFPDTLPMEDVVALINRNNQSLPTLYARFGFEVNIVEPNGRRTMVNGDNSILIYRKPSEFRMVGNKPAMGRIFEVGTTADRFWMIVSPPGEPGTIWWGHYRNLDKPCIEPIPIRPDALMEVLGIGNIDEDLLAEPAPTMRFNTNGDAYMFVWSYRDGTKWVPQKEIWYDRRTLLPRLVLLFDRNGRIILHAQLSDHQDVQVDGAGPAPKVATKFSLFFPETRTTMSLELSSLRLQHRGVPNERSIRFPADPGVSNEIQIDAGCID